MSYVSWMSLVMLCYLCSILQSVSIVIVLYLGLDIWSVVLFCPWHPKVSAKALCFLGAFHLPRSCICLFIRSFVYFFVQTNLVTAVSYKWLEQSR